jgi:hypothetical protein
MVLLASLPHRHPAPPDHDDDDVVTPDGDTEPFLAVACAQCGAWSVAPAGSPLATCASCDAPVGMPRGAMAITR